MVLNDVDGAVIRNSSPPSGAVRFIETRGSTKNVKGP